MSTVCVDAQIVRPGLEGVKRNRKDPERRLGAFLVLLSVWATRGGCPFLLRRGSLAFMEASGTFIPSSVSG
jgi:hypothetical protein